MLPAISNANSAPDEQTWELSADSGTADRRQSPLQLTHPARMRTTLVRWQAAWALHVQDDASTWRRAQPCRVGRDDVREGCLRQDSCGRPQIVVMYEG